MFGERIKKAREAAGLSQREITDALGWSSPQFISNVERGLAHLPPHCIPAVARMIKISESVLIDDLAEIYRQKCVDAVKKAKRKK